MRHVYDGAKLTAMSTGSRHAQLSLPCFVGILRKAGILGAVGGAAPEITTADAGQVLRCALQPKRSAGFQGPHRCNHSMVANEANLPTPAPLVPPPTPA